MIMKITKISIILFLLFLSVSSFAQRFEYGVGLQYLRLEGKSIVEKFTLSGPNIDTVYTRDAFSNLAFFTVGLGGDVPIYKITDEMNISIQANINVGFLVFSHSQYALSQPGVNFYAPAYLTYNWGSASSRSSSKLFGVALGLGYQFSGYLLDKAAPYGDDSGVYHYAAPSILVEVSDFGLFDNVILRFETQLGGSYLIEKEYKNVPYGYSFYQSTLSFIIYIQ